MEGIGWRRSNRRTKHVCVEMNKDRLIDLNDRSPLIQMWNRFPNEHQPNEISSPTPNENEREQVSRESERGRGRMNEYHQWQGLIRSNLIDRIITFQHDAEVERNKVRTNLDARASEGEAGKSIMNSNSNPFTLLFVIGWKCRVQRFYHRCVYLKKISMEGTSERAIRIIIFHAQSASSPFLCFHDEKEENQFFLSTSCLSR